MEERQDLSVEDSFDLINQQEESIVDEPIDDIAPLATDEVEITEEEKIGDLHTQQMDLPEDVSTFVDTGKGEVIDKSKLSHFDVIKALAAKTGTVIRDPKSSCKKCYGRGYIGVDTITNTPFPCTCIYPPKSPNERRNEEQLEENNFAFINRRNRRRLARMVKYSKIRFKEKDFKKKFMKESPFAVIQLDRLNKKVELELV